ncbi:arginyltransferase [Nitrosophilus kaiyonis]|uniref:arginyltransferase n=1 Tax=Nitrosophilus kaiyonis TaxID=2930200 RepID=UPI002492D8B0|nr:arginyltransferase [Nitrosophilus kaiyonis]
MKREFKENESIDYCVLDYECPYLPDKKTRMYYRFIPKATKDLVTNLIQRGWRRFGFSYFHPICKDCNECKSLRIDVKNFKPSRSQRRAIKKNRDTQIIIRTPTISFEHIELYNKYHKFKAKKSGWKYTEIDLQTYYEEFVVGAHNFGKEVLYFYDKKLIGVDLIDIVDDGISSIYFFYDPDFEKLSLGIYSLLIQIDIAKKLNLDWIYLGYWVNGCKSFAYKTQFKPYELLDGFPKSCEIPNWEKRD